MRTKVDRITEIYAMIFTYITKWTA